MDFLDPKRKKAHHRRLIIGYILIAVAVVLAATVLLFSARGFDIDRKTGSIIQNGIVFTDSQPSGATVYVNDKEQRDRTATRLVLPAGNYTIRLELDGYRSWSRTFPLEGGGIVRLTYPLLIPKNLQPVDRQTYANAPNTGSASPDNHWLLLSNPAVPNSIDEFDLTQPQRLPVSLVIPPAALTTPAATSNYRIVEWASDNKHLLLGRSFGDKHEFILFNRDQPAEALNLTAVFGLPITQANFKNKKADQLYIYDANGGIVRTANTKDRTVSGPLLSNVLTFDTYGDNLLFYATAQGAPAGKVQINIMRDDKIYPLRQFAAGTTYLLEFGEFDGHWYYSAGATAENTVYVYKDPLDALTQSTPYAPSVATIMRLTQPQFISLSEDNRIVSVQNGSKLVTYDAEDDRQFKITLDQPLAATDKLSWIDAQHLTYAYNSISYLVDFDGSNVQNLGKQQDPNIGPFFDKDRANMFMLAPSLSSSGRTALQQVPLTVKR